MRTGFSPLLVYLLLILSLLWPVPTAPARGKTGKWSSKVKKALARAGANQPQLVKALKATPAKRRQAMAFLIANMPDADLRSLRADFLLENVQLAYQVRKQVPWGRRVPKRIFLNDVLPYANVDEARDPWRKQFLELCLPLVKGCKAPAEAGHRLNSTIFQKLRVRYSAQRHKPHQSPKESIALGLASCTGLSILLCDACRSVGIPARVVGTPMWANERGNHTWVEIWDDGWHFTGAAEPDPKGLDHAWFEHDAGQAKKDSPRQAIYAASFRRTKVVFPLVWAPERKDVYAENVTARYAKAAVKTKEPAPKPALTNEQRLQVEKAARAFFSAGQAERAKWQFDVALDQLLVDHEEPVRRAVWEAYRAAPIHAVMTEDFGKNQVRSGKHLSPYTVKKVGKRPPGGWPLFIALHGGGGAPKKVNDDQWKVMQIYYHDQASVTGYQYLALRAPNDSWNGFYEDGMLPLISNLIRQFLLLGDVDPAKVYLLGYSHGGYGVFFIGPKMPDRFAAIHSSAAAPTAGTISPKTLRHTRFTFMIGEHDNAHGRCNLCKDFAAAIRKLQEKNKGDYPVLMELKKGFGHGGLPDRDKIKEMYPFTRNPVPRHLTWELTDPVIRHFCWLSVPEPGRHKSLDGAIQDNAIQITTRNVKQFDLYLDGRLIAFDRPLRITVDGKAQVVKVRPQFVMLCRSLLERGDPQLAFTCGIRLNPGLAKGSRAKP